MHGAPLIDHRTPAATLTSCSLADERPRARSPLARPAQPAGAQAGPASQPASQPAGPALDQRWTRTYSRKRPQPASKASAGVDSRASQMPASGRVFSPLPPDSSRIRRACPTQRERTSEEPGHERFRTRGHERSQHDAGHHRKAHALAALFGRAGCSTASARRHL